MQRGGQFSNLLDISDLDFVKYGDANSGKRDRVGIHLLEPGSARRSGTVIHQSDEYQNWDPRLERLHFFGELRGSIIDSLQSGAAEESWRLPMNYFHLLERKIGERASLHAEHHFRLGIELPSPGTARRSRRHST